MAPMLKMNEKGKEMVHQKKWAFSWFLKFCKVSDDWTFVRQVVLSHLSPTGSSALLNKFITFMNTIQETHQEMR